jgi:hypothetical protein
MWEQAALWALIFAVVGMVLDKITVSSGIPRPTFRRVEVTRRYVGSDAEPQKKTRRSLSMEMSTSDGVYSLGEVLLSGAVAFVALLFTFWTYFYNWQPAFEGWSRAWILIIGITVTLVVFGFMNWIHSRVGLVVPAAIIAIIGIMLGYTLVDAWWLGSGNAKKLAGQGNVVVVEGTEKDPFPFPPTDTDHIAPVPDQVARQKAETMLNQGNLGTLYDLGNCFKQSVKSHVVYVCEVLLTEHKPTQQAEYTITAVIEVNAENPAADPVLHTKDDLGNPYNIKWWPGGVFGGSLERLIWMKGYNGLHTDDYTLEVDDQWRPYYTLTQNDEALRLEGQVPKKFLTVDVQTGDITPYELNAVPAWADRVLSANAAKQMADWWGHWGLAKYQPWREKPQNRYKVSGEPIQVFTDQGMAWQILMSSWRNDNAIQYILLADTKTGSVRAYHAPPGLVKPDRVREAFNQSDKNLKSHDPIDLALHKVYDRWVWVGGLVPNGTGDQTDDAGYPKVVTFIGVGMINALNSDSANVIVGASPGDAYDRFSVQIATSPDNSAPGSSVQRAEQAGTILRVNIVPDVVNGAAIYLTLVEDPAHTYRGRVLYDDDGSMNLAQSGDKVTIGFLDTKKTVRAIASMKNGSLSVRK